VSPIRHVTEAPTTLMRVGGGARIEPHRHDGHQLVYVSTGVLHVRTPAGSYVVCSDRAAWLPAGTSHEHRFFGDSSFRTLGFARGQAPPHLSEPTIIGVSPLLRELLIACTDGSLNEAEDRRARAVIADQLRRMPQAPIFVPTATDPRLRDACDIVAGRLGETLSIADLAREVATSERTLSRLYRSEFGTTYPQWRTNLRVVNAMLYLASGRSVTETGQRCGWATTSSFIDTFRRVAGSTPGTFAATRPARS
jgi:AraC-like DNA-binding protein